MATKKKAKKESKVEVKEEIVEAPKEEAKKDDGLIDVIATGTYKKYGIKDSQLGYIPEEGEEFKVTKERFKVLIDNRWNEPLVTKK